MTNEWQEKLKKFQEARKEKSAWYEKTARELLEKHQITACLKCDCRGWGRETKHSRAHAHTKKRIVCLNAEPKGYKSFFTLLHEIGHIVADKADYSSGVPRSLAEHNATEWAYQTLKELVPSQNLNDQQMDNTNVPQYKQDVGSVFKIGNYISLPIRDIDTIASIIQTTNKGVMVWFYFKGDEWTDVPAIKYPYLDLYAGDTGRHSVTAVDFTLYQGKKVLIIEDSWGKSFGLNGQRIITEDFFRVRNWFAAYPINFAFDDQTQPQPQPQPSPVKPKYKFTKPLVFIPWDNAKNQPANLALHENQKVDVKVLQDILKYEGLFPSNIASTSYYGSITAKAVYAFQVKHKVASMAELNALIGRRVGEKTIKALNEIYSV